MRRKHPEAPGAFLGAAATLCKGGIHMAQTSNPLGTESIGKLLLKFSIPTTLTLLVNSLYNVVDQIFIGQGVGVDGIAATNVTFPLTTIAFALALLIGDGCAANISLCLGRNQQQDAQRTFGNAFLLLIVVSVAIVAVCQWQLSGLLTLFGATPEILDISEAYGRIVLFGLPFQMCNVTFTAIIRADGSPTYSMTSMIVGALINVVLDPVFIFGLNMGVQGAAIATIVGQIVSGIICLCYIPRFRQFRFTKESMRLQADCVKSILSLGFPSCCIQVAAALTQVVMNNLMRQYGAMTQYGSEIALSCYGMMMKLYQIVHSMFVGMASGTQPINGFNFGAKKYDRVRKTYRVAFTVSLILSVIWFIVFQLFPRQIATLFVGNDPMYLEFAQRSFHFYFLAFLIYGPPQTTASFFQAIGKPGKAMLASLSRQILFLIPLATLILAPAMGLDGAFLAAPIADVLTFVLTTVMIALEFRHWHKTGMLPAKRTIARS